jgi:hypothetical protein
MSAAVETLHNPSLHQRYSQHFQSCSPPKSPIAPSYSPITPKAQIVLPVPSQAAFVRPPDNDFSFSHKMPGHAPEPEELDSAMNKTTAHFIEQPPNLPFSADDSSDAIALRAAISTLQFQKQKAQGDLKTLESMKKLALSEPEHFTAELKAGNLNEDRPKLGGLRAIMDSDDSEEDSDDEGEEPTVLGAEREDSAAEKKSQSPPLRTEIPDSQPSQPTPAATNAPTKFPRIPGAQDVVRTPYINWEKYGVVGTPLDSMHAQQQRWPGTTNFTHDRGREHAVAAPYSPFLDDVGDQPPRREVQEDTRRDSGPQPSITGTISEHVMETRSRN